MKAWRTWRKAKRFKDKYCSQMAQINADGIALVWIFPRVLRDPRVMLCFLKEFLTRGTRRKNKELILFSFFMSFMPSCLHGGAWGLPQLTIAEQVSGSFSCGSNLRIAQLNSKSIRVPICVLLRHLRTIFSIILPLIDPVGCVRRSDVGFWFYGFCI